MANTNRKTTPSSNKVPTAPKCTQARLSLATRQLRTLQTRQPDVAQVVYGIIQDAYATLAQKPAIRTGGAR